MDETEITSAADAAGYLACEVINEYHDIPAVRIPVNGNTGSYVQLNGRWYSLTLTEVRSAVLADRIESAL